MWVSVWAPVCFPAAVHWPHAFTVGRLSSEPWGAAKAECPVQGPLVGTVPSEVETPPHTDWGAATPSARQSASHTCWESWRLTLCSCVSLDKWFKAWAG